MEANNSPSPNPMLNLEKMYFQNEMNVTAISPTTVQFSRDGFTSAKSRVMESRPLSRWTVPLQSVCRGTSPEVVGHTVGSPIRCCIPRIHVCLGLAPELIHPSIPPAAFYRHPVGL